MSLFQGLFTSAAGQASNLFSEQNLFRRQGKEGDAANKLNIASADTTSKKKRKSTKDQATAVPIASNEISEQPVKKKLKKEKASKHLDTSEAAPAVAAEVRPSGQAGSSNVPAAVKPKKQQRLKTDKKVAQAATGSIPPANGKKKPTDPHSKPEKASASGVAKAFAGAATEGSKRAKKMVAASDDAVAHDDNDEEHESKSDDEETTIAGGTKEPGAKEGGESAPAKQRRTEEEKAERLRRTVFVGNLPVKVKVKLIKQTFSQYGTVESVRLRSLPLKEDTKLPRHAAVAAGAVDESRGSANAYVVFSSGGSASHALAHNMREFEGRHIRVDRAAAVSKGTAGGGTQVLYESARSVFVGNLPFDTQDEELIELFGDGKGGPGNVTAVRIVRDPKTSVGKGIAFVEFSGRPAARMAMSADGRVLRGRQIRVARVAKTGAAAAAAAEAATPGGSRLRTPFSRGVKAGKMTTSAPRKDNKSGKGEGTPRAGGPAAWQGMRTKGQKKVVRGFAAKERDAPSAAPGGGKKGGDGNGAEGKLKGKRPSVAARKDKLLSTKKQKRT